MRSAHSALCATSACSTGVPFSRVMRPRSIGTWSNTGARDRGDDALEPGELVGLDVDIEIGRGALGQTLADLGREIALHQRDRDHDAETDAERDDNPRRRAAGTVQIGERQPQAADGAASARAARRR